MPNGKYEYNVPNATMKATKRDHNEVNQDFFAVVRPARIGARDTM